MAVIVALGCPGEFAGTGSSEPGASSDAAAGHGETGAHTTEPGAHTSSTGDPSTTAAIGPTGTGGTDDTDDTGDTMGTTGDITGTTGATDPGPVCGDGVRDPDEQCDDGNDDPGDHCLADCTLGPAGAGEALPLSLLPEEHLLCMTVTGDDLVVGAIHWVERDSMFAHVQQVPLPDAGPAAWSYDEQGGEYGRRVAEAATASDGDVIVVGYIFTELQKPDTGGYMWLARFTSAGALVWSHELAGRHDGAVDLELGPDDTIVVASRSLVCCGVTARLAVFDPQGQLVWQFAEADAIDEQTYYGGVAVGDDGTIFVGGGRRHHDGAWNVLASRVLVRAFTSDGAPLWQTEQAAPDLAELLVTDLVRTRDDALVITASRHEAGYEPGPPALALAGFDDAGALLWWQDWAPPAPWKAQPDQLVAADDGGVFLVGRAEFADPQVATLIGRFAADGEPVWSRLAPGVGATDALVGPDGRLFVLTPDDVRAYPP